jgi:hypothetical protein
LPEVILAVAAALDPRCNRRSSPLDAQQLVKCPVFFGSFGVIDRLLDQAERIADLPGMEDRSGRPAKHG